MPGPIPVPRRTGGVPVFGWVIMGIVLVLAVLVYVGTHGAAPGTPASTPPPTWGRLTLARVAVNASAAAGEPHPSGGVWVSTTRMYAVPYLIGRPDQSAEADFLVAMTGRFHAALQAVTLPGSMPHGGRLVLLVRGFDGKVTGLLITDRPLPDLRRLGIVHPLALGGPLL